MASLKLNWGRRCAAGSLAFGIDFIALTLANSELFTENFLVPIAAVTAGRARLRSVAGCGGAPWRAAAKATVSSPPSRPEPDA